MKDIKKQIEKMVIDSFSVILEEFDSIMPISKRTRIYGGDSPLDSTAVVSMVVDLEMKLADEIGFLISLSDDRAMSQKRSPFRDVESMVDYILVLYQEHKNE